MDDSLQTSAKHFLLGNAIYGQMLTEEQRKELARNQARRLAQKAKAKAELDAMLAEPDKPAKKA